MSQFEYDKIEEYGTKNVLYFYYVQKNNLWGIADIDLEEIIPCRYENKPDINFFQEQFKTKGKGDKELLYPDYYAYEMVFKVSEGKKFGLYFIQKQIMPFTALYKNFTKHIYDGIIVDTDKKEVRLLFDGHYKTYKFSFFEYQKVR